MQKDIAFIIYEALEKTCLLQYSESDSPGIISALIVMSTLCSQIKYMDVTEVQNLMKSLKRKKWQRYKSQRIKYHKQLEDITPIDTDNDFVQVNIHCTQTQNGTFMEKIPEFHCPSTLFCNYFLPIQMPLYS